MDLTDVLKLATYNVPTNRDRIYYIVTWRGDQAPFKVFLALQILHESIAKAINFPVGRLEYTVALSPLLVDAAVLGDIHDSKASGTYLKGIWKKQPRPLFARFDGDFFSTSLERNENHESVVCFSSFYSLPRELSVIWQASRPTFADIRRDDIEIYFQGALSRFPQISTFSAP